MPPRSKRRAKTASPKKKVLWSLLIVFLLVAGAGAYYLGSTYQALDSFQKDDKESPFEQVEAAAPTQAPEPPKWEGSEPVNILLMGVDARGLKKGEVPRSDTMLVASLDPVNKRISLFSILRDTYVNISGYGSDRINSAITKGPNTAMETVSDLLGIPIQYYVYTDFQGFIALVDAVGGVDFEVEKDMVYKTIADGPEYDIDLKKGYQHLDGNKALQYVRFRHDATSDYTRTERQRAFLKAIASKLTSTTSLLKLPTILSEVSPYIDTNLSPLDMLKLASVGYDSAMAGSVQIPPMNLLKEERVGQAEVIGIRSESKLREFVQETLTPPEPSPEPSASPEPGTGNSGQ